MPRTFHSSTRAIKPLFGEPIPAQESTSPSHWVEVAKAEEAGQAGKPKIAVSKAKKPIRTRAKKELIPASKKAESKTPAHSKSEPTPPPSETRSHHPQHSDSPAPTVPTDVADQTSRLLHHIPTDKLPTKDPNPQYNLHSSADGVQWVKLPNQALHRLPAADQASDATDDQPLEIKHSFSDNEPQPDQPIDASESETSSSAAPKIRLRLEYHHPTQGSPEQTKAGQQEIGQIKPDQIKSEEPAVERSEHKSLDQAKPTDKIEKSEPKNQLEPPIQPAPAIDSKPIVAQAKSNLPAKSSAKNSIIKWVLITIFVGLVLLGGVAGWNYLSATFPGPDSTVSTNITNISGKITSIDGQADRQTTGDWAKVSVGQTIKAGDVIRTDDNSRAAITIDDGSVVRLDQDSTLAFTILNSQTIRLEQRTGQSYHDVHSGTNYQVVLADAVVTAHGTGFLTKIIPDQNRSQVAVSLDQVSISAAHITTPVAVNANNIADIDHVSHQISVSTMTTDQLADGFWQWNLQLDQNPQGAVAPSTTPTPTPTLTPTPTPEISLTPTPVPTLDTTVSALFLTATAQSGAVRLNWKITGVAPSGFKLAMSVNPNPTFPAGADDVVADIPSPDARSYTWTNLDSTPRHFRLGVYNGHGGTRWYSNDVTATALP